MKLRLLPLLLPMLIFSSCEEAPTRAPSSTPKPVRIQLQPAEGLDTALWNRTYQLSILITDDDGTVRTERTYSTGTRRVSWTLSADVGQSLRVYGTTDSWNADPETLWVATANIGIDEPVEDSVSRLLLVARRYVPGTGSILGEGITDPVLFSPAQEWFVNPVTVRMATRTSGATVRYSLGTDIPTRSAVAAPESLVLDGTTTFTAVAWHPTLFPSEPVTRAFRFRVDTLRPNKTDSIFPESTAVRWTTATRGVVLRYRTDGIDPDSTSPVLTGAFALDDTSRSIRLRGFRQGYDPSPVFRRTFRIVVPQPMLQYLDERLPEPDGRHPARLFPMASSLRNHYTLDGSTPDTSDPRTDLEIPMERSSRLRVVAYDARGRRGPELDTFLVLNAPSLEVDGDSGEFQSPQKLPRPELPANFRAGYTLDGADPDSLSPAFPETLLVDRDATLKVRALRSGWRDGPVVSLSYRFSNPPIALSIDTGIVYRRTVVPLKAPSSALAWTCTFDGTTAQTTSPPCPDSLVLDSSRLARPGGLRVSIRAHDPSLPATPPTFLEASWIWGGGWMTDSRDGSVYATIRIDGWIGRREWLASDMRYAIADSSECWPTDAGGCSAGRNYAKSLAEAEWSRCGFAPTGACSTEAATNICPPGWRLPEGAELRDLGSFATKVYRDGLSIETTFSAEPTRWFTEVFPQDLLVLPERWAVIRDGWNQFLVEGPDLRGSYAPGSSYWRPVRCLR